MKKTVLAAWLVLLICGFAVSVSADFGELSWKNGDGFLILSEGGDEAPDSFGFAVSDGEHIIHLYNIGGSFQKPFAAKLNGLSVSEAEIRQFSVAGGVFSYGEPIYVTDGVSVKTLVEIKSELSAGIEGFVNPELYRDAEQSEIEKIVTNAKAAIAESDRRYPADAAVSEAEAELLKLKTDEQLCAEELAAAKETAIAEISGFLDKTLYREAEQTEIDSITAEFAELINSRTETSDIDSDIAEAKLNLSGILTDAQLDANALLNAEVVMYLEKAVSELGATRFIGNEKKIINIVVPVMEAVIVDGEYGRIVISPEYVKETYASEVEAVKALLNEMDPDFERPAFEQKLAQLDMETQAFLKEYFL